MNDVEEAIYDALCAAAVTARVSNEPEPKVRFLICLGAVEALRQVNDMHVPEIELYFKDADRLAGITPATGDHCSGFIAPIVMMSEAFREDAAYVYARV